MKYTMLKYRLIVALFCVAGLSLSGCINDFLDECYYLRVKILNADGEEITGSIPTSLYIYDENLSGYSEATKELNFDFPLKEGDNIVRVKAYSLEKLSSEGNDSLDNYAAKTFSGKCTYEPQQ